MYSTSQNEFVPVLIPEWNSLLVRNCVPILWCHPDPIRGVAILSRPAYNLPWEQWEKLKLTVSLFFCTRISQFLRKHGVTYRNYIPVFCKHLNTFLVHFFSRERIRQYIYCCAVDSKSIGHFFHECSLVAFVDVFHINDIIEISYDMVHYVLTYASTYMYLTYLTISKFLWRVNYRLIEIESE